MSSFIPFISSLSPKVIRVLGCNPGPMTLQGTNTYIIGTGKRRVLLDTGEEGVSEYIKHLGQVLKNEGISLEHIIISHWHLDHIGGLGDVINKLNQFSTVWKYQRTDIEDKGSFNNIKLNFLQDKQEISTEGATLRILHTPGHSTDHVVIFLKEENTLFSGDCILGEGTAVFEDLKDYMESLKKLSDIGSSRIYPGHGPVIEDASSKIDEYIKHRNEREKQILNVLTEEHPLKEMDIVRLIYKEIPENLHKAAALNVNHHLVKLQKENRVTKTDNGWILSGK